MPYSKRTFVVSPRGFTDATSVAASPVTERGAPADADGACGVAVVRSVRSAPRETPAAFVATTR